MKLVQVEETQVKELIEFSRACKTFALECKTRVELLEQYKVKADATIKDQEKQVYTCRQDLEVQKKKQSFLYPVLALVLGFAAGFVITR